MIRKYLRLRLVRFPCLYEFALRLLHKPFDELYVARKLISKGDTVFDIGANVGQFTILFSVLVGERGSVHAFEPVDQAYSKLINNIEKCSLRSNIKANKIALSDKNSEAFIYTPVGDLTQSSLAKHTESDSWSACIEKEKIEIQKVITMTLDTYMKENKIRRINYIKCDVEGSEFAVIKGALKALSAQESPIILLEFFPPWAKDFGYDAFDLFSYLNSMGGYIIYHVCGKTLIPIFDFNSELPGKFPNSLNYLCLPPHTSTEIYTTLGLKKQSINE